MVNPNADNQVALYANLQTSIFNILQTSCILPNVSTIAIPPISANAGGIPMEYAAKVMINNIIRYCIFNECYKLYQINIVCYTADEYKKFLKYLQENYFN